MIVYRALLAGLWHHPNSAHVHAIPQSLSLKCLSDDANEATWLLSKCSKFTSSKYFSKHSSGEKLTTFDVSHDTLNYDDDVTHPG